MKILKRLDPHNSKINHAERILHLSRYEYAAKIINKFHHNKKTVILDAACGLGYGTKILQDKTRTKVIGIDLNSTLIKHLIKVNKKNNKMQFIQSDVKSLPFTNNSIDYIVCFETIEHLKKTDGIKTIEQFKRVLKKSGLVLISSPNSKLTKFIHKIFPKYKNPFHLHEYHPNELKKLLEKNNLRIIESRGQYLFFPIVYFLVKYFSFLNFFFQPNKFFPLLFFVIFLLRLKKSNKNIN